MPTALLRLYSVIVKQEQDNAEGLAEKQPLFNASNVRQAVLRGLLAGAVFAAVSWLTQDTNQNWPPRWRYSPIFLYQDFLLALIAAPLAIWEFGFVRRRSSWWLHSTAASGAFALVVLLGVLVSVQTWYVYNVLYRGGAYLALEYAGKNLSLWFTFDPWAMFAYFGPLACGFAGTLLGRLRGFGLKAQIAIALALAGGFSVIVHQFLMTSFKGVEDMFDFKAVYSLGLLGALTLPPVYAAAERIDQAWVRRCNQA